MIDNNFPVEDYPSSEQIDVSIISTDLNNNTMTVSGGEWNNSNQSEVWSNYLQGADYSPDFPATNLFDGNTTTTAESVPGASLTFVPPEGIPYTEKVECWIQSGAGGRTFSLNDGPGVTNLGMDWTVVATGSGTINKLVCQPDAQRSPAWSAIRVDGRLLIDAVNDSQVWSSLPTTATGGANNPQDAFDGDLATNAGPLGDGAGSFYQIDFSGTNTTVASKLEVQSVSHTDAVDGDNLKYVVNGVDVAKINPDNIESGKIGLDFIGQINTFRIENTGLKPAVTANLVALWVDGEMLIDTGVSDFGNNTVKKNMSGTGVVGSVNLESNTMTLSSTNEEWIDGYFVTTPEKNAVEMRGYLSFDSQGNNVDLERLPQSPVLMDDVKTPKLNFPSTFSTGEGVDTDLPFPTYLETYVQASNSLGSSLRVKSNELFPNWTGRPYIAPGSYRVMEDEFAEWCYWACSSDYRSAVKTIQDAEATVQELRTKAQNMASNFLDRDDVY